LLARLEEQVRSLGRFRTLTCATVERPDDHPLRPQGYIPIGRFLARTGFARLPGVTTTFTWRESDGVRREHAMQFWRKGLEGRQWGQPAVTADNGGAGVVVSAESA
jgi:hypothetical protein